MIYHFSNEKKFDYNLWKYLQKNTIDLGLRKRIDLAIKTIAEVANVYKKDIG